jgi:hypothetical protein
MADLADSSSDDDEFNHLNDGAPTVDHNPIWTATAFDVALRRCGKCRHLRMTLEFMDPMPVTPLIDLPSNWKPKVRRQCNKCRRLSKPYEAKRLNRRAQQKQQERETMQQAEIIEIVTYNRARKRIHQKYLKSIFMYINYRFFEARLFMGITDLYNSNHFAKDILPGNQKAVSQAIVNEIAQLSPDVIPLHLCEIDPAEENPDPGNTQAIFSPSIIRQHYPKPRNPFHRV